MCEQCEILEQQINKYKRIVAEPLDPLTRERLKSAIDEYEQQKAELHPNRC